VILAILHFLRRMSDTVETQQVEAHELKVELARAGLTELPPDMLVYEISGPMFFGAVENFERALVHTHTEPKRLIIRLLDVPFMDITGIQTLEEVIAKLGARGVRVILCEANARVLGKLRKAGVVGDGGPVRYADGLHEAIRALA